MAAKPKPKRRLLKVEHLPDPSRPDEYEEGMPWGGIYRETYSRTPGSGTFDTVKRGKYTYVRARVWAQNNKGVRVRQEVYAKTDAELSKKLKKLNASPGQTDRKKLTLGEFLEDRFLPGIKKQVKRGKLTSPNTYASYEKAVRVHIVPDMGKAKLIDITTAHVDAWLADLVAKPRAKQQAFAVLKRALNYAVDSNPPLLDRNPIARVNAPEARKREQRILTVPELQKLLAAANGTQWYALLYVASATSMRQGELFGLTWDAVNLARGYLIVKKQLRNGYNGLELDDPKTPSSVRRIDLPKEAVAALQAHLKSQEGKPNEYGLVFPNSDGGFIHRDNFAKRIFKELLKTAKLPAVTFHSIRHSTNSALAASGTSLKVLQQRLGHSTASTTFSVYIHAAASEGRAAATKIGTLLGGAKRGAKALSTGQKKKSKGTKKTL